MEPKNRVISIKFRGQIPVKRRNLKHISILRIKMKNSNSQILAETTSSSNSSKTRKSYISRRSSCQSMKSMERRRSWASSPKKVSLRNSNVISASSEKSKTCKTISIFCRIKVNSWISTAELDKGMKMKNMNKSMNNQRVWPSSRKCKFPWPICMMYMMMAISTRIHSRMKVIWTNIIVRRPTSIMRQKSPSPSSKYSQKVTKLSRLKRWRNRDIWSVRLSIRGMINSNSAHSSQTGGPTRRENMP